MHRIVAGLVAALMLSACSATTSRDVGGSPSPSVSGSVPPGGTDAERRAQLAAASEALSSKPHTATGTWDLSPYESPEQNFSAIADEDRYDVTVRGKEITGSREYYVEPGRTLVRKNGGDWAEPAPDDAFSAIAVLSALAGRLVAASSKNRSVEWLGPEIGATNQATGLRFFVEAAELSRSSDPALRSLDTPDKPTYTITAFLASDGRPAKTIVDMLGRGGDGIRITSAYDWVESVKFPTVP